MKTIFVVEDQATNLKLVEGILVRAGFNVVSAETADIGMPMIIESQPDLVLMDIHLPGTDGLTATRILKNKSETKNIPIIALTARAMEGDRESILEAGCDEYAAKPLRYKELLAMIEKLLARN